MHLSSTHNLLLNALFLFCTRLTAAAPAASAPASAPPPSSAVSAAVPSSTVPFAKSDPNGLLWDPNTNEVPEAIRGALGANIIGPQNIPVDLENADFLAPPTTDSGTVYVVL